MYHTAVVVSAVVCIVPVSVLVPVFFTYVALKKLTRRTYARKTKQESWKPLNILVVDARDTYIEQRLQA